MSITKFSKSLIKILCANREIEIGLLSQKTKSSLDLAFLSVDDRLGECEYS